MNWTKILCRAVIVAAGAFALANLARAQPNLLTNPGFEADPHGPTSVIFGWHAYGASPANVASETFTAIAHGGSNYLQVYQASQKSTIYNGVYQDNLSGPGAVYAADGWAYAAAFAPLAGQNAASIEITFRDAAANVLALYRSALITTNAIAAGAFLENTWIHLPVTNQYNPNTDTVTNYTAALVAPARTSFVRCQITFEGDAAALGGAIYFDDLTLTQTAGGPQGNWNIVWSDEFNGSSINASNWAFNNYNLGNGEDGWGNNELEYYTYSNAYVGNGLLHMMAYHYPAGYNGYSYTSSKMITYGLFTPLYGRFAFRAKLPAGQGLWPTLWLLPQNSLYGPWPSSGEIDVTETTGSGDGLTNVFGTLHFGGPSAPNTQSDGPSYNFLPGNSVTNFNTYLLEWTTNAINWYVNGCLYETQTNWWSASTANTNNINPYPAPFNEPFYIAMNLAIGGTEGGTVDNSIFPVDMQVDYVRYYELTAPFQLAPALRGGKVLLTWPSNIVCHLESTTNLPAAPAWTSVAGAATPFPTGAFSTAVFYRLASP